MPTCTTTDKRHANHVIPKFTDMDKQATVHAHGETPMHITCPCKFPPQLKPSSTFEGAARRTRFLCGPRDDPRLTLGPVAGAARGASAGHASPSGLGFMFLFGFCWATAAPAACGAAPAGELTLTGSPNPGPPEGSALHARFQASSSRCSAAFSSASTP